MRPGAVATLDETYCAITSSTAAPFLVQDASNDERLLTHAARDSVMSATPACRSDW